LASFVLLQHAAMRLAQSSRGTVTPALRELLGRDVVCREIVEYLMRHNEAADTARGIADWWIHRDLPSTRRALLRLEECGVIQAFVVQGETFVYAYTKKAVVRQSLARYLREPIAPPAPKGP